MTAGLVAGLVAPLVGVGLTLSLRGLLRAVAGLVAAVAGTGGALMVAAAVLRTAAPGRTVVQLPLGVEVVLIADGLAAVMLVTVAVVMLGVLGVAAVEDQRQPQARHVATWPLLLLLWWGLTVLFLAGDLLTIYLMLELVGACGALLVTLRGDVASLLAGMRYFYAELAASTTMLVGVGLVWSQTGTLVLAELPADLGGQPTAIVGLAAISAGLLLKVPLIPLHLWLSPAHTLAPRVVSPVLSAVMVKAAFVVLMRVWFLAVPDTVTFAAAQLLGGLGALAVLWGSLLALRSAGLKQLVAASTAAQLGLLFLLAPLVMADAPEGWTGGMVLAVAHAPAKAGMLLAAVLIVDAARLAGAETPLGTGAGSRGAGGVGTATRWPVLAGLQGTATMRPVAVMAFGVGGLGMVGLPPSGGFVGKWYLLLGSVAVAQWWWIAVVVLGTLLTAGYLMRVVRPAMGPPVAHAPVQRDARDILALALASLTVMLGLWPGPLLDLLAVGAPDLGG